MVSTRDRLIERWMDTIRGYYRSDAKRVYYLSMEFLTGRLLSNSLLNVGFYNHCREALSELELSFEEICQVEPDAALGNGGLGRLAACFLDSMATLSLPGYGYGIRYEYGMFHQEIEQGWQVEHPDNWLQYGNPWEFPRPEALFPVKFGGRVVEFTDERGEARYHWIETDDVMAMAFDTPVPGFGTVTVNNMRLWSAKAPHDFNLKCFNEGNYLKAAWPVGLFEEVLPRHIQIIYEFNHRFLEQVRHQYPGDADRVRRMSLIDERPGSRRVRMAHLAIVGSHAVNGVSAIHTDLMKRTIFADFHELTADKIVNITNGITPRRWLNQANPGLASSTPGRSGAYPHG